MKVTVLGCGGSGGVPLIGCKCPVCTSANPKNKRSRVSLLIEAEGSTIIIDTSPDLREQSLKAGLSKIDAVVYTHDHADHINGIDDLRAFNYTKNAPLDIYSDEQTLKKLKDRFSYVFLPPKPNDLAWFRPCLSPITVTPSVPFNIGKMEILPFEQVHGQGASLGLRIGAFAYSTDTNGLSETAFKALEGTDTWIVDCLRREPAPTHAHLAMTLGWIKRVKPRRAYLTHLHHGFDYDELAAELPEGVFPAYDGLQLSM